MKERHSESGPVRVTSESDQRVTWMRHTVRVDQWLSDTDRGFTGAVLLEARRSEWSFLLILGDKMKPCNAPLYSSIAH